MVMASEGKIKLLTGSTMPVLGMGTWLSKPGEVEASVEVALKAGYRHLDCAHIYQNEAEIGKALQKCFKERVCKREDLFVTSKLFASDMEKQYVVPALQLTLKKLQLDYLDLYLVHLPFALRHGVSLSDLQEDEKFGYYEGCIASVWEGMEDVLAKGLALAIGISNFSIPKTEALLRTAKTVPAVNQVECHAYLQQKKLKEYLDTKGICLTAYCPLGAPARVGIKEDDPVLMDDPVIKEIAVKKDVTPAQICISFLLHCGMCVIPKSVTPKRILDNYQALPIDKHFLFYRAFFSPLLPKTTTFDDVFDFETDKKF